MYAWDWTPETGWQWKQYRKTPPANYEIWRQGKDCEPTMLLGLDNYRAVISIMAKYEQAEKDRGATTIKHLTSPKFGVMNGFTVSTQQQVIVTNDGSGKPRCGWAEMPSAHYWVEAVPQEQRQCEIENERYARKIGA